jgi:four helix bundle protein
MSFLEKKSYAFALRIVQTVQSLQRQKEFVLSRQLLRSGTAIGALIAESQFAQSKADFASKLQIALKEANETRYWIRLLRDSSYLTEEEADALIRENEELISILVKSIKTSKADQ